ncbi:hypothetical protein [Aquibacillus sediminis]|nr:hypothetical protein [Aquibacillus sediminis]
MGYYIFIDTNIIYDDLFFRTSRMKQLLKFTSHEPVDLCITEFNYNEII